MRGRKPGHHGSRATNFVCEGPGCEHVQLWGSQCLCRTLPLQHEGSHRHCPTDEGGMVQRNFTGMLIWIVYIFMCHETLVFFWLFSKYVKTILACRPYKNRGFVDPVYTVPQGKTACCGWPSIQREEAGMPSWWARGSPRLCRSERPGRATEQRNSSPRLSAIRPPRSFQRWFLAEFQAVVFGDSPCSLVALAIGSRLDKVLILLFTGVV